MSDVVDGIVIGGAGGAIGTARVRGVVPDTRAAPGTGAPAGGRAARPEEGRDRPGDDARDGEGAR